MRVLKQLGADLGRILGAIFGTAFVLVVTSGVGEGIAEAADTGEVIIGLVLGVVVVGLAAMAISYVVLPSLRHLSTAYSAALDGKPRPADWRKATYYRYWMHMAHSLAVPAHFGLRSERYKLIFFYGLDRQNPGNQPTPAAWEFYDLANDPGEMENLYGNPAYEGVIASMKVQLKDTREELGETDRNYPAVQRVIDAH